MGTADTSSRAGSASRMMSHICASTRSVSVCAMGPSSMEHGGSGFQLWIKELISLLCADLRFVSFTLCSFADPPVTSAPRMCKLYVFRPTPNAKRFTKSRGSPKQCDHITKMI